ncbi:MAG: isochorismatase family protein, partial [Candidatus Schmidhempelia sp.]|nr:isochorismatase family protein [Candidatus Schmidhempelia sp.]
TVLYLLLRERQMTEVLIVNDYSYICILHTAIDADNLDYKQIIHEQAVTRFDSIGYR